MQPSGIRRIRSENPDGRPAKGGSVGGVGGKGIVGGAYVSEEHQQRRYNVDDITSLEKHRRLSSMEKELLRLKEKAATAIQDALYREQEVHRCRSEHATVRQHLEGVIRELLEKQKSLSAELHRGRQEMQLLSDTVAARESALQAAREMQQQLVRDEGSAKQKLQLALEASRGREEEAAGELSVVVEKLSKADTYIQTLSDEAVARQLEVEQLRAQLASMTTTTTTTTGDKPKKEPGELASRRKEGFRGMLMEMTRAALACADTCDEMSRECDELIDVVREEQQRQNGLKGQRKEPVTFISCKPTGIELEHLLHATLPTLARRERKQNEGDDGDNNNDDDHDDDSDSDNGVVSEVTVRVVAQLLHGMQMALQAGRDDILVAGRAYAELCRACRDTHGELAALQAVCCEKRAAVAALEEQLQVASESMRAEQERADRLQASLDDSAGIMEEAAALTEERMERMDKLLRDNVALEEALQAQRRALRERDDANAAVESKLRSLQEEVRREQTQSFAMQEELHRAKRAAKLMQEERDGVTSQLRELEHHMQVLKEESQQCDVDRLYLRKQVEELQGQLEQMQKDRQVLRDSREAVEWERRQLLLHIDRLKRDCVGDGAFAVASPTAQRGHDLFSNIRGTAPVENQQIVSPSPPPPLSQAQATVTMDKVRWWEAKLQAITSSSSSSAAAAAAAHQPLFLTPLARQSEKTEDLQGVVANSASLASLAYGTPSASSGTKPNRDVL